MEILISKNELIARTSEIIKSQVNVMLAHALEANEAKFQALTRGDDDACNFEFDEQDLFNFKQFKQFIQAFKNIDNALLASQFENQFMNKPFISFLEKFEVNKDCIDDIQSYLLLDNPHSSDTIPINMIEDLATKLNVVSRCQLCTNSHFVQETVCGDWIFKSCVISPAIVREIGYRCTFFDSAIEEGKDE
jgi:hypothetical protein